jgi:hypothetical protein
VCSPDMLWLDLGSSGQLLNSKTPENAVTAERENAVSRARNAVGREQEQGQQNARTQTVEHENAT